MNQLEQNQVARLPYETPQIEVIEMELEGVILQMSGENGGWQDWQ